MASKQQAQKAGIIEKDEAAGMLESGDADEKYLVKSGEVVSNEKPRSFSEKTWMEDLTLEVEGKNLYVSKMVLATICPGFRKTFEGKLATEKIVLSGKKYEDFLEFLLCVYPNPDTLKKIDEKNVMTVVPFIAEYQVVSLLDTCGACVCVLVDGLDSIEDLLFYLDKAVAYGLVKAKEKCLNLLNKKNVEEIEQSKIFGELPLLVKTELFAFMAKRLNKLVKEQMKTIDSLNKEKENNEHLKKCFRAGFPINTRAEMALLTTCGSIHFEFTPMTKSSQTLTSKHVNCGESILQLQVSLNGRFGLNIDPNSYLDAELIFISNVKNYYVKYDLVNNFSLTDNVVINKEGGKVSIIKWGDLINKSKGFLRHGKVILDAYFMLSKI